MNVKIKICTLAILVSFMLSVTLVGSVETALADEPFNPDDYQPMPLPEWEPPREVTETDNNIVVYDPETKQERTIVLPQSRQRETSNQVPSRIGADGITGHEGMTGRSFTDLNLVSNPDEHPWSMNVKVYMTFSDGNYVCSGVLIDPFYVLTAGRCVYDTGTNSWAESIRVVPGYENGEEPYGSAESVELFSWKGWTENANLDWNMGYILLDQPIGGLTGSFGYGFDDDDSFFTNKTFNNPGYPVQVPYNGQYLYNWYGRYDTVEEDALYHDKMLDPGQLGSGSYWLNNDSRRVYSILTHSRGGSTGYTRINSDKFYSIQNRIEQNTPTQPDLIPLDVNTSVTSVIAGNALNIDYVVHNYSSATWNGTVSIRVYLSTNDIISTNDQLLTTRSWNGSLASKNGVIISHSNIPIPRTVQNGPYWLGVYLDVADANRSNNDSSGWDAVEIQVLPPPPDTYEPDDRYPQATYLAHGSSQNHNISPADDTDWFYFTLNNPAAVTLQTSGSSGDTRMWLYDSNLNLIEYDDDDGTNRFSLIERTCEINELPAGRYYVKIDEYGNNNVIASYDISLATSKCLSPDRYEPDDSSTQATLITNGETQNHNIFPADEFDWLYFTLDAPSAVTLETSGPSGDTRMWLYDSNLTEIEFNDDWGTTGYYFSRIDRICEVDELPAGTYYVKVDEYLNNNFIANYNISLTHEVCPSTDEALYTMTRDGVMRTTLDGTTDTLLSGVNGSDLDVFDDELYVNRGSDTDIEVYDLTGQYLRSIAIPTGVEYYLDFVVLPDKRIALFDNDNDKIYFINQSGSLLGTTNMDAGDWHLQSLDGVVVDNQLVFSEDGEKRLLKIDLTTYQKSIFKDFSSVIPHIWLGAIDFEDGLYYLATSKIIYKFTEMGNPEIVAELPEINITGLAVVGQYAYASVNFSGEIYQVNLESGDVNLFASGFNYPQEITYYDTTLAPAPRPILQSSATSVAFNMTVNEAAPAPQSITISNVGTGALYWAASEEVDWLALSATEGNAPATIDLSIVNAATLAVGSYTGTITLEGSEAQNSPQTVTVTLQVNAGSTASLQVDPTYIGVTAYLGDGLLTRTINLSHTGTTPLSWTAVITSNDTWLSLDQAAGSTPSQLVAAIDITGMTPGIYTYTAILISAPEATNSFLWIPVELTLSEPPASKLAISPPTSTVETGDIFDVSVQVEAGPQLIIGAETYLNFDPSRLAVMTVARGSDWENIFLAQNSFDNDVGTIDFGAVLWGGQAVTGTTELMNITFQALTNTGVTSITISETSPRETILISRYGVNLLAGVENGRVIITEEANPILEVQPTTLSFELVADAVASQTLQINNLGPGDLIWSAATTADWLTVSPAAGLSATVLDVLVDTTGLIPGNYTGQVVVSSDGGEESVAISLVVTQEDEGDSQPVDVTISIYKTVPVAERISYTNIISFFADSIYEMSNGAHQVRNVTIFQNGQNARTADVLWNEREWPRAFVSGFGRDGWSVIMGDVFPFTDRDGRPDPFEALLEENWCGTGYTLGHEFGHYFYSLYDEYRGSQDSDFISFPQPTDDPVPNSVMHSQWAACWNPPDNLPWLNFSTENNNTRNTAQHRVYGASGWTTLVRPVRLDPRNGFRLALPQRLFYPELAEVAPTGNDDPTIELPADQALARDRLNISWIETRARNKENGFGYQAHVNSMNGEEVTYPEPVLLVAQAAQVDPIAKAGVAASVVAPNNSTTSVTLKDDGIAPDVLANDGFYSGYMPYNQAGAHQVTVTFNNDAGTAETTQSGYAITVGPNGEIGTPQSNPVNENFNVTGRTTVVILEVKPDDHGNAPSQSTPLTPDNSSLPGKIDYADDVDVFEIVATRTGTLWVRVTNMAFGMDPQLHLYQADGTTLITAVDLTTQATEWGYLLVDIPVTANETIYAAVSHRDSTAKGGLYTISAGELLVNEIADSATLTIVKQANITHTFTFTGELGEFTLATSQAITFPNLNPTTYTISEDPTSFPDADQNIWALVNVTCVDDQGTAIPSAILSLDHDNFTVDLTLQPDQHLTCTFLNERAGVEPDGTNIYLPLIIRQ